MWWVLDKSAHVRILSGAALPDGVAADDLAICPIGQLEWLYSARSAGDYDTRRTAIRDQFAVLAAPADAFEQALEIQRDLAHHHGMWHRTPLPDVLIAVVALHHRGGILHKHRDFARIAAVRPALRLAELA
jgi:predicted nucleic acid-binding protein